MIRDPYDETQPIPLMVMIAVVAASLAIVALCGLLVVLVAHGGA